jgi:hypothetical protein
MKKVTAGKKHGIAISESTYSAWMAMKGKQHKAGFSGVIKRSWWPMTSNGLVSPLCLV